VPWFNRDQVRSPMPWGGGGPNGGFSAGKPWLRMAPDADTRTVANQEGDPASVLNTYRALLWLRRRHPALQVGDYRRLPTKSADVFAFERATDGETLIVAVNFSGAGRSFRVRTAKRWTALLSTHTPAPPDVAEGDELTLRPYEAVILRAG
jgi:alpha-glucosidase